MTGRSTGLILVGVALVAAALGFWLARTTDRPAPVLTSGTWLPQPRSPGEFSLIDQNGLPFPAARLSGAPSLVYFGFTHCPDLCPTTLLQLAQAKRTGAIPGLRVLFISVDPARDTPALLAQYVHAFDPDFIGLTGTPQALGQLSRRLGITFLRIDLPGGDYTMDHSGTVFLLDRRGRNVAVFNPPFDVPRLSADLRLTAGHLG